MPCRSPAPSTLAIIVTYNPRPGDLVALLSRLRTERVDTIVVDNCSDNIDETAHQIAAFPETQLVRLNRNYGIAYAQNIGLHTALAADYEFALLLDQDSLPDADFVEKSQRAFATLDPDGLSVAAVAPSYIDSSTQYLYPFVRFSRFGVHTFRPSEQYADVSLIISSGSTLRLKVLPAIGLMNESLFIDHVDTEWCLRVIAKGFRLVGLADNRMKHSVGDATIRILGRNLPAHTYKRRYLATRNLFFLIFHADAPKQWKIKEAVTSLLKLLVTLPYLDARTAHVRSYALGVHDGIAANFTRYYA
jgi:rhamnosyltransferase